MDHILEGLIYTLADEGPNGIIAERVLWVGPDQGEVVVIQIHGIEKLPKTPKIMMPYVKSYNDILRDLEGQAVKKLAVDPFYQFFASIDALDKELSAYQERWDIIKDLISVEPDIYMPLHRGPMITETSIVKATSPKNIYFLLKLFWAGGKTKYSLLPRWGNCGAPGKQRILGDKKVGPRPQKSLIYLDSIGVNVSDNDKRIFRLAVKEFGKPSPKAELTRIYDSMVEKYYRSGYVLHQGVLVAVALPDEKIPTIRQFRYWYEILEPSKARQIRQVGSRKYNLNRRPLLGDATSRANGPGHIFEIDATVVNIYLVSSVDRTRIIGRPVLYIIKDVFSRVVAGFYVGLEGPSHVGAMLAIENMTVDKVAFCAEYGIEISKDDWPCQNTPEIISADRGEMESSQFDNLPLYLNVELDNTPPYRADLKGIVEQHFDLADEKLPDWTPGGVLKDWGERGAKDYRLDAKLTLRAFTQIMIWSILEHNQKVLNDYPLSMDMVRDGINPIPTELWNWGIKNRPGHLREYPGDIVRLNLMKSAEVSITKYGIRFEGMYYSCGRAVQEGWFEGTRIPGRKSDKVEVSYDPRSVNHIWVRVKGNEFEKCNLVSRSERFLDLRLEEVQQQVFYEKVGKDILATPQRQIKQTANAHISAILQSETEQTNSVLDPTANKAERIRGINQNKKEERGLKRQEQSWDDTLNKPGDGHKEEPGKIVKFYDSEEDSPNEQNSAIFDVLAELDRERGL